MEVFQNMRQDDFPSDLYLLDLDDLELSDNNSTTSPVTVTPSTTSNETSPIVSPKNCGTFVKTGRLVNPVPRHKRSCHITAEIRRRNKIKICLDNLQDIVPSSVHRIGSKESNAMQLVKVAEHCRALEASCKSHGTELSALRLQIVSLNAELATIQNKLPESGAVKLPQPVPSDPENLQRMFNDYIRKRSYSNWKFWIFGVVIRPLFEVYVTTVDSSSTQSFLNTIGAWISSHLSLSYLRPAVTQSLLTICMETAIMTQPETVPEQVVFKLLQSEHVGS